MSGSKDSFSLEGLLGHGSQEKTIYLGGCADDFITGITRIVELHLNKKRDYGTLTDPFANIRASLAYGVKPWIGAMIRAGDKMTRIQSFISNGNLANEPLLDSLEDLASYALIARALYLEEVGCQESDCNSSP